MCPLHCFSTVHDGSLGPHVSIFCVGLEDNSEPLLYITFVSVMPDQVHYFNMTLYLSQVGIHILCFRMAISVGQDGN